MNKHMIFKPNNLMAFKTFLNERKLQVFHLVSEDQPDYDPLDTLKFELTFNNIIVLEDFSLIYLKNEGITVQLSRVTSVDYTPLSSGVVITVTCRAPYSRTKRLRYSILAY